MQAYTPAHIHTHAQSPSYRFVRLPSPPFAPSLSVSFSSSSSCGCGFHGSREERSERRVKKRKEKVYSRGARISVTGKQGIGMITHVTPMMRDQR